MKPTRVSREGNDYLLMAILALIILAASCDRAVERAEELDASVMPANVPTQISEPRRIHLTIPQGARLTILLSNQVSSERSAIGDPVEGTITSDVIDRGRVVIPEGSVVRGAVTDAHPLREIDGYASLAFTFDTLATPDGNEYPISASFARIRAGSVAQDDTLVILGRIVEAGAGEGLPDDSAAAVAAGDSPSAVSPAIAANIAGMEVDLPAKTTVLLTMRAPVVVEVEGL